MSPRAFLKYTAAGRWLLVPYRLGFALTFCLRQAGVMLRWAFASKEHYNHTYHLTDLNRAYLAAYTAAVTGHDESQMAAYLEEALGDVELTAALERAAAAGPDRHNSDREPRFGRRLGWYAIVRATKPKVVVETGVDRGLGTALLAAALRRNQADGCDGLVYATDINPRSGHLLVEPYRAHARILPGDSVALLKAFDRPVDVFLHDSDHRPEYEWAELLAVEPRLHATSVVLTDNARISDRLQAFARRTGRRFLYFQDEPQAHWWPGDGIGAAFRPGEPLRFQSAAESHSGKEAKR